MEYLEITITTSHMGVEPVLAALSSIGIDDAEVQDPEDAREILSNKEKYEWDYVDESVTGSIGKAPLIRVYLDSGDEDKETAIRSCIEKLKAGAGRGDYGEGADFGPLTVSLEKKDDSGWKDKWKEYFKPSRVSEHIVIKPTWEEYDPEEGDIVVEIDPGMAFGTGTHETTSMCIGLLEKYMEKGMTVLDAGCGSGILSIVAAKLGAGSVLGIDIDTDAVRVSKENIEMNGVSGTASAEEGDITKKSDYGADLIVANLMAELICMISCGVSENLEKGGIFIASGILTEKEEMVSGALGEAGLTIKEITRKGEWTALAAVKE